MIAQLVAAATVLLMAAAPQTGEELDVKLTLDQSMRLAQKLGQTEPFLRSAEAKQEPQSLNRFFHRPEYDRLVGNPVLGYWSAGGFRWQGVRVAWDGIESVAPSARPITRKAWDVAFQYVAQRRGLVLDRAAPIRIRGACVAAVVHPTPEEPVRGVLLEVRVEGPGGQMLYRFGMGRPTLEDAVGAAIDVAIGLAMNLNQPAAK